jgi:hypothetical protein
MSRNSPKVKAKKLASKRTITGEERDTVNKNKSYSKGVFIINDTLATMKANERSISKPLSGHSTPFHPMISSTWGGTWPGSTTTPSSGFSEAKTDLASGLDLVVGRSGELDMDFATNEEMDHSTLPSCDPQVLIVDLISEGGGEVGVLQYNAIQPEYEPNATSTPSRSDSAESTLSSTSGYETPLSSASSLCFSAPTTTSVQSRDPTTMTSSSDLVQDGYSNATSSLLSPVGGSDASNASVNLFETLPAPTLDCRNLIDLTNSDIQSPCKTKKKSPVIEGHAILSTSFGLTLLSSFNHDVGQFVVQDAPAQPCSTSEEATSGMQSNEQALLIANGLITPQKSDRARSVRKKHAYGSLVICTTLKQTAGINDFLTATR